MSWISRLYQTYESCASLVGKEKDDPERMLLPVGHTLRQAQIEIAIDENGNYILGASRILKEKKEQTTVIPCTEESGARTSTVPHPLFDTLKYIAGDYTLYGGEDGANDVYLAALKAWCDSPYAVPEIQIIYTYLKKGCLLADLVAEGIIPVDTAGKVPEKWTGDKEARPEIYEVCSPLKALVRIRVQIPGKLEDRPWLDPAVWQSHLSYQQALPQQDGLCYICGEMLPVAKTHAKFLRYPGDSAKLISSNDKDGFTYRGRFKTEKEALTISYEVSQKAHHALKWLIAKQGIHLDSQVFVAWGLSNPPVPNFMSDTWELQKEASAFFENVDMPSQCYVPDTRDVFAAKLKSIMHGYRKSLDAHEEISVLGLNSATKGRLSILYYRELYAEDFFERLDFWHGTCCWYHTYRAEFITPKKKIDHPFTGAPAPKDIVLAAYGTGASDKLLQAGCERLVPCILDGMAFPRDMLHCLVRRAGNPVSMNTEEYCKVLSIACAAIKKVRNDLENPGVKNLKDYKEVWKMALDPLCNDRSYLFGRWLAYAQNVEQYIQQKESAENHRMTNAERMMHQFSVRPKKTAALLNIQLNPYFKKFKENKLKDIWGKEMHELLDRIDQDGFTDEKLDEIYLLGYASQLMEFEHLKQAAIEEKNNKESTK